MHSEYSDIFILVVVAKMRSFEVKVSLTHSSRGVFRQTRGKVIAMVRTILQASDATGYLCWSQLIIYALRLTIDQEFDDLQQDGNALTKIAVQNSEPGYLAPAMAIYTEVAILNGSEMLMKSSREKRLAMFKCSLPNVYLLGEDLYEELFPYFGAFINADISMMLVILR